jgi:hypothetical protein
MSGSLNMGIEQRRRINEKHLMIEWIEDDKFLNIEG